MLSSDEGLLSSALEAENTIGNVNAGRSTMGVDIMVEGVGALLG
jgi:hypothetical protein